ncbi:hypothetical protein MNBD_UNCLBAC01-165 [hydrothermal vent metagenome]|uniref:Type II secretion system protein n=1 Tax=hydrothermal vent metagenome TaxID=652676 RepID=A0A3B1DFT7_9ZZZZ
MGIKIKKLRNKLNATGMTLIENLISVFIVSIVFFSLTKMYYLTTAHSNIARHKVMAVNLAQAALENLFDNDYSDIVVTNYSPIPLVQGVTIDMGETDESSDDLTGTMTTELVNLNGTEGYKFIVSVTWNDHYGQITETVESLMTDYE